MTEKLKLIWYHVNRFIGMVACYTFFRIRIYGKENVPKKGAFLLVSNHQSFIDPILCGMRLKQQICFLARASLWESRIYRMLTFAFPLIPVRRGKADMTALKKMVRTLQKKYGICLFPEETRTQNGRISDFKPGFGFVCKKTNAPVIPVVIEGAHKAWHKNKKIFTAGDVDITVCYCKPIPPEKIKTLTERQLAQMVTNIERKTQNNLRYKMGLDIYPYEFESEEV
jgi:1-acyl-sn-glycerol-3-phosphate acyltransferase